MDSIIHSSVYLTFRFSHQQNGLEAALGILYKKMQVVGFDNLFNWKMTDPQTEMSEVFFSPSLW